MVLLSILVVSATAQSNLNNLIYNGDFSNGLSGWTPGVLHASQFGGYPKFGVFNTTSWRNGVNPFAYLDVPGQAKAFLNSTPFLVPYVPGGWSVQFVL